MPDATGLPDDQAARTQLEERLRSSEERWQLALEGSQDGLFDWDLASNQVFYSPRWEAMFGYAPDTALPAPESFSSRIHPDEFDRTTDTLRAVLKGARPTVAEVVRMTRVDGSPMVALHRLTARYGPDGRAVRIVGTTTDMTEQYRLTEALRESEALAKSVLAALPDAVFRLDRDGRVLQLPDTTHPFFMRRTDLLGRGPVELLPAEHAAVMRDAIASVLDGGGRCDRQFWIDTTTGRRFLDVRINRHTDDEVIVVVRDLTASETAEELHRARLEEAVATQTGEARRIAAQLRAAFEATAEGLLVIDQNGTVTDYNRQFLQITGVLDVAPNVAAPGLIATWAHENLVDPEACIASARSLLADPDSTRSFELRFRDGRAVEVSSRPQSLDGKVAGRVISFRDVSERRTHEQQVSRTRRLESLGTLAGGIAHDLNNALAPVLLALTDLRAQYPANRAELDIVAASAERASAMVRQLLTFARGSEGAPVPLQVPGLVREIETIVRATFPKNIEIRVHVTAGLPTIVGDPTQLHQFLLNLCVNARDAMPRGGRLTISVEPRRVAEGESLRTVVGTQASPGLYVCLRVEDTGVGMPHDVLDRMFEPFFTTKPVDQGTGLGLSTALGIAKGAGGFMQVDSVPGRGTWVCACFPAGAATEALLTIQPLVNAEFRGQSELVLLVDDEHAVRTIGRKTLERLNLRPLVAADGAEALLEVLEHKTSLRAVITDANMPTMDGLRFIRALRQVLPNVPVILASGRPDAALEAESAALGVVAVLQKPFTEETLAHALGRALRSANGNL